MAYTKTTWKNGETPLNADNMNHIEEGIFSATEAIDGLVGKSDIFVHNIHIYYTDAVTNVHLYFSCMSFDDTIITNISSLNIALGNIPRNISCTGIVKNNDSFFAVTSISWEMRFQQSMLTYITTSGEDAVRIIDALNKHTPSIDDVVTQIQ